MAQFQKKLDELAKQSKQQRPTTARIIPVLVETNTEADHKEAILRAQLDEVVDVAPEAAQAAAHVAGLQVPTAALNTEALPLCGLWETLHADVETVEAMQARWVNLWYCWTGDHRKCQEFDPQATSFKPSSWTISWTGARVRATGAEAVRGTAGCRCRHSSMSSSSSATSSPAQLDVVVGTAQRCHRRRRHSSMLLPPQLSDGVVATARYC
mmetsp:Transcript_3454/g.8715  ORF Transcript_3454/g.8715 Transcript_3454/m.8715 type:complete len:211 (+) Transcript_3454:15-647(+)